MSELENRFNRGVNFDYLHTPDTAERYCVLKALKGAIGHENRVSRKQLVKDVAYAWYWHAPVSKQKPPGERRVRAIISELRKNGALICSTGGTQGGYWIPTSREEITMFIEKELTSRAMDLLVTGARMSAATVRKFGGQQYIWDNDIRRKLAKAVYSR